MKSILVIDDDKIISDIIEEYFTKMGYHVSVANDGKNGIDLFGSANNFDVVITDVDMPVMDGHAVANRIRTSEKPHIPIIAITGASHSVSQKHLFNLVLLKPFPLHGLKSIIESYFR